MARQAKSASSSRRAKPRARAGFAKRTTRKRASPSSTASRIPISPPSTASRLATPARPPAPVFDTAAVVDCPYCGEAVEITLDPSSGRAQRYVEDCAVCCRPWQVSLTYDDDGHADVYLATTDD